MALDDVVTSPRTGDVSAERKALRIFRLRSLLAPAVAWRWSRFARDLHRRVGAAAPPARVLAKPLRNYLKRGLGPTRRLEALLTHHRLTESIFSRDTLGRLLDGQKITLADVYARKSMRFQVVLAAANVFALQREGELAIAVLKVGDEDVRLARLAFSFTRLNGDFALVIGGMQGPFGGQKRQVIDATREMWGLRPKDAVLLAVRELAAALGAAGVHAVGDAEHVLNRLQDDKKLSVYDDYWRERGATRGGPYGFVFGPIETGETATGGRVAVKAAISKGARAFAERARIGSLSSPPPQAPKVEVATAGA